MIARDLKALSAALFVGVCGCAVAFAIHLNEPPPELGARPVRAWKPVLEAVPSVGNVAAQGPGLDQALRRPLFRKSRQPFDPEALIAVQQDQPPDLEVVEVVAPPPVDTSQYVLKGVLIDAKGQQALIATAEAPEGVWLHKGAELSSWLLSEVRPDRVVLANGAQTVELKLYVDNLTSN
jgi:hypothetical protein